MREKQFGHLLRPSRLRHAETLILPFVNCHNVNEIFFGDFRAQQIREVL